MQKDFQNLPEQLKIQILPFLSVGKLFSLMLSDSKVLCKNDYLWRVLINKVFSVNQKEKESDKYQNKPKEVFYEKVKALEKSIKEIEKLKFNANDSDNFEEITLRSINIHILSGSFSQYLERAFY